MDKQEPYSMEEHIAGAQERVPDHPYEKWYEACLTSWRTGITTGIGNWWDSMRNNVAKNPMMVVSAFTFLADQIKVAIFLREAIASRDYSELLDMMQWVDSDADCVDELEYRTTGFDLVGQEIPKRMLDIQRAVLAYNARRSPLRDARVFRAHACPEVLRDSAYQHSDWEVDWGADWKVFVHAAQGLFEEMSTDHQNFQVEPWSLCGMVCVFGSHPEIPDVFCDEPVVMVGVEHIVGLDRKGQADLLVQMFDKAQAQWLANEKELRAQSGFDK